MAKLTKLHNFHHSFRICNECCKEIYEVRGYFYALEVGNDRFILCDECGKELEEFKIVEKNFNKR